MKTPELIRQEALKQFNRHGLAAVTLRHLAAALGKSYGNITYHYPNKDTLITALYQDMVQALAVAMQMPHPGKAHLQTLLMASEISFDVSIKFLFLYKDYVEIVRQHHEVAKSAAKNNGERMKAYLVLLKQFQAEGLMDKSLSDDDLLYLMELSGAMRTFYFLKVDADTLQLEHLKKDYTVYVNRLLYPYLSAKGKKQFRAFCG